MLFVLKVYSLIYIIFIYMALLLRRVAWGANPAAILGRQKPPLGCSVAVRHFAQCKQGVIGLHFVAVAPA